MSDLNEILQDSESQTEEQNTQSTENNTEPQEARAADDTGEKPQDEPAKPEENKHVPREALIEERKKRQASEQRYQEIQRQLSYLQGKVDAKGEPEADEPKADDSFWDDPAKALQEVRKAATQEALDLVWQQDAAYDERRMMDEHEDYEEKRDEFARLMQRDPSLQEKMRQTRTPAEFVYNYVTDIQNRKDPKQLEAEIRAKVEAEMKAKYAQTTAASTPQSQVEARGSQPGAADAYQKPTLADILGETAFNKR